MDKTQTTEARLSGGTIHPPAHCPLCGSALKLDDDSFASLVMCGNTKGACFEMPIAAPLPMSVDLHQWEVKL